MLLLTYFITPYNFRSYSSSHSQKIPSHRRPATLHRPHDNGRKITKHRYASPVWERRRWTPGVQNMASPPQGILGYRTQLWCT